MILANFTNVSYDISELKETLNQWQNVLSTWNDNKAQSINDNYYATLCSLCNSLETLTNYTSAEMNRIKIELESI